MNGRRVLVVLLIALAGCSGLTPAALNAHRAQLNATIEGVQAHQAWVDCVQQMRENPQDPALMLHPCILDAMRETDEAVSAANDAIEAMGEVE